MKVIDSFTFFNEFDMLKFRLNYLNDVVDHFIISESNYTHSGKPKPYYLDEVWNNIPENIKPKIIRLKYEPNLSQISLPENVTECDFQNGNWKLEREQRDLITYNLSQFSPYDLFMVSDVDEIPNKKVVETFKNCDLDDTFCCVAKCEMFYYNFATYSDNNWAGTVFSTIKTAQEKGCDHLRNQRFVLFPIDNGGWHFSYFGDVERIKNKLNSFAHQEYNKDRYKNDQNILDAIQNKKDLLQRGKDFIDYNFYNFPEDLRILITNIFPKQFYEMNQTMQNGSGATETSYLYLQEHYTFPENVFVSHLPEEIKKSNHQYKILWAHHAYDQPVFVNFDHNTVNHIVSPSQWNKDQLVKFLNVPEHKISVIPNGVAEMFQYSNQKTKTMIFTSIPYKGLEVLSKVIPLISHVHKDVKFKIFSSMSLYGPSNDQFIELYEYLKTLPNVEYSSAIDREELVKHYQESAFFIHPNIWEETFGVSMIEAMKCGAYPIITDIGALSEVAGEKNATIVPIEGENTSKGWKVTDNFIRQFADACCLALDYYDKEPKFYQEVSKLISDYVTEKYDWKKIAGQWKNLVDTVQNHKTEKRPVYYCMTSTKSTEKYTDLALKSFFQNTELGEKDKFFLIDNDGQYSLTNYREHITLIANNTPKTFASNMNFVMKLALVDEVDFFGLSNDVVFTENWNQDFNTRNTVLVPLCNQKLIGDYGNLKIEPVMDLENIEGKENELNEFVKTLNVQPEQINKSIIGFYCFYIPHEILSTAGFLDENFENGGEDVDYRLRVHQLGYDVDLNYNSYLIHFSGKSTWRSGEKKEKTLTREKNYRKHFEKKWGKKVATELLAQSSV
jgi:glycosyltransferase involved in cell wall biosynthesis